MAAHAEPADRHASRRRDCTGRANGRCCVCDIELSDDEVLIGCDFDPVGIMDVPGMLMGHEIRCEGCIALLPNCPVCSAPMNECPTCGAHYCRRHAATLAHSDSEPIVPTAMPLCDFCEAIRAEIVMLAIDS